MCRIIDLAEFDLAESYARQHKAVYEGYCPLGYITRVWRDADRRLCIQYQNGQQFKYAVDNGKLVWW